MNILEKITAATRERVELEKKNPLPQSAALPRPPFLFEERLRKNGMSFICEVKKASPSKGIIAEDFPYLNIAKEYEQAGADAISVLTEPKFFLGHYSYLSEIRDKVNIPLLRKDFIIDIFQIEQSANLGADAILLICAILSTAQLSEYIAAANELGLSCLVETHDETELEIALAANAKIVGVNNRNLKTFEVDTGNSIRLRKLVPADVLFVSESGISTADDVELLRINGVNAVLVGETLMRAQDKSVALAILRGGKI